MNLLASGKWPGRKAAPGEDLFPAEGPRVRTRHALLSLLVVALMAISIAVVGASPAAAGSTREARMLVKINNARAGHGLPPLTASPDLMAAARAHTVSMAGARSLFHTTSFSSLCCWHAIGENVGYGFTVRGLHRQFMHSAPHRANLLDPGMHQVGVGIVERNGALWVTEVFRDPH
jgi:uncharacterized protein YkwD